MRQARRRTERLRVAPALVVDADHVLLYRATQTHLAARLPRRRLADAAFGGIQDSSPRSALLSLQARVDDLDPDSWEHPDLAQIWFRWADYVVPRNALGAFTLGTLPRNPEHTAAIERLADRVSDALAGTPQRRGKVSVPELPAGIWLRAVSASGRVHIRWDASTIELVGADRPPDDPEDARRELARRFLHWLGPATASTFAVWAGIQPADATATFHALADDLLPVEVEGNGAWLLAADEDALLSPAELDGVRLLPPDDPYRSRAVIAPDAPRDWPHVDWTLRGLDRRLLNSLSGRILVDGRLIGGFGRRQGKFSLAAWAPISDADRSRVEEEVERMSAVLRGLITLQWLN